MAGNENDFLQDYSGINAAGAGVQGFIKGMNDYQDRDMKKQEFDAKMKAMQTQVERDALGQKIELRKNNMAQGIGGELQEIAPTGEQHQADLLKEKAAGQIRTSEDTLGHATGYKTDPESIKMEQIKANAAARAAALNSGMGYKERAATDREERMAQQVHQKVLTSINSNTQLQQRTTQFQNLDNALSGIVQADHVTPQQIMEFQQAVRGNMGIKGGSGVGEREETYFKTLGMNAAAMRQFLTGDPASLAKNSPLMDHFKQLASVEQQNISKQYDKQLMAAAAGQGSFYRKHPEYFEDLKEKLAAQRQTMVSQNSAEAPSQGLVQPEQGFLSKAKGFLFGEPAQASAPTPAAHPQDAQAVQWAKQNLTSKDPTVKQQAAEILKANGG